ncbi:MULTISPECIES: hypothetical protein [Dietzia]|uniref:Uncharacterized protein n=1 Tax=Dietzia cinnamea TaxID=321318 RepID=A0A4R3ZXN9_9ACTN|nr:MULTISPECIES: hypothetical protein [Dietzia]MBM7230604.1 hypothetical protein [Dietzia cinnamea]MCT1710494.1 hypothetical protein [Dietzia cinnamea]MCT2031749.1 hypothetical protein [Dietzia cinnamea]MCT2035100.1 hypothetical protein [Dietzia cinnamea]MCT2099661.1 hypothetical protein [Dietzia cinnamea]
MGSIQTFLPGLATGSDAVNTGSQVVDAGAGLFADVLETLGGFVTQITGSLS